MDMPIQKAKPRHGVIATIIGLAVLLSIIVYHFADTRSTKVASADLSFATVKKGEMKFSVSGVGTLAPRLQKLQTARSAAMVEEIYLQAGSSVKAGQALLRLSAPLLRQQMATAKAALQKSESDLREATLNIQLEEVGLNESAAQLASQLALEIKDWEAKNELASLGIVAKLNLNRQEALVKNLRQQIINQQAKATVIRQINQGKIQVKRDQVAQQREALDLVRQEEKALLVTSPIDGAIQDLFVTLGQAVAAGERVAQVATTNDLIAMINVPQNKAASLSLGAAASLRIQGRTIRGQVLRIDPKVRDGAVLVDIAPVEPLPIGVRSAQAVSADIDGSSAVPSLFIEKSEELFPYERRELFIQTEKNQLTRRAVQLGSASGNVIEIISGVAVGERIALKIKPDLYQFKALRLDD